MADARFAGDEEVTLVVVNTPDRLYQFNAFESDERSPDAAGLNYEVQMMGAAP